MTAGFSNTLEVCGELLLRLIISVIIICNASLTESNTNLYSLVLEPINGN